MNILAAIVLPACGAPVENIIPYEFASWQNRELTHPRR
jgi:hypothetical protein